MRIQARGSILINRPIQEVWTYLDDEANDPVWRRPYIKQVTRLEPGPTKPGARFRGINPSGVYLNEVTLYEPPLRMSWKYVTFPGPLKARDGSYVLSLEGEGARMTLEERYDTPGLLGALLSLPASIMLNAVIGPRLLKQLKAGVESRRAG